MELDEMIILQKEKLQAEINNFLNMIK